MSASEKLKDLQKTQLRKVTDTLEVSYVVLPVSDHDLDATLEKLATAINVQLIQGSELILSSPLMALIKWRRKINHFCTDPADVENQGVYMS